MKQHLEPISLVVCFVIILVLLFSFKHYIDGFGLLNPQTGTISPTTIETNEDEQHSYMKYKLFYILIVVFQM